MHQDFLTALKLAQYELIHSRGRGPKDITIFNLSAKLTRSYSYLCRISSLTEDLPFPSELEVPAMKIKNNFDILRLKAIECGFVLCKMPRTKTKKGDENIIISEYQVNYSETINALYKFFQEPTSDNFNHTIQLLNNILSETCEIKRWVEKKHSNQIELEFSPTIKAIR